MTLAAQERRVHLTDDRVSTPGAYPAGIALTYLLRKLGRGPTATLMLAVACAACGTGDAASGAGDAPPDPHMEAPIPSWADADLLPLPQPAGERAVGARLTEYEIELTRSELPAGEIEFHVVNAGTTIHYLLIRSESVYAYTPHLSPCDSAVLRVDLPPGEYSYLCTIRDEFDHYSEGMRGTLTVR
jgi:hypothetical protein